MRAVPDGAARFSFCCGARSGPLKASIRVRGLLGSAARGLSRCRLKRLALFAQGPSLVKLGLFKSEACVVASRAYGANDIDGSVSSFDRNLACAFDERLRGLDAAHFAPAVKLGDFFRIHALRESWLVLLR